MQTRADADESFNTREVEVIEKTECRQPEFGEAPDIPTRPHADSARVPAVIGPLQGQLLRLSEYRIVAIYLRGGSVWIADFVEGRGKLVDVNNWFRFNCGTPTNSPALRRMALESAIPLSPDLIARIESLHCAAAKQGGNGGALEADCSERVRCDRAGHSMASV